MGFAAALGLWAAPRLLAAEPVAASLLDELRRSFTLDGKPVPPEVFRDFGDGDLADSSAIRVTIDVLAAVGSNLYADPLRRDGAWVVQTRAASKNGDLAEATGYRFIGTTDDGLLVATAFFDPGGSGRFFTLHVLDAALTHGFDDAGLAYGRIALTTLRAVALGDRWDGTVRLAGNRIEIATTRDGPAVDPHPPVVTIIMARRP